MRGASARDATAEHDQQCRSQRGVCIKAVPAASCVALFHAASGGGAGLALKAPTSGAAGAPPSAGAGPPLPPTPTLVLHTSMLLVLPHPYPYAAAPPSSLGAAMFAAAEIHASCSQRQQQGRRWAEGTRTFGVLPARRQQEILDLVDLLRLRRERGQAGTTASGGILQARTGVHGCPQNQCGVPLAQLSGAHAAAAGGASGRRILARTQSSRPQQRGGQGRGEGTIFS